MANPIGNKLHLLLGLVTTKVALVTLIGSDDRSTSAEDLKEKLRRDLESSSIQNSWTVEKVTVLDAPQVALSVSQSKK